MRNSPLKGKARPFLLPSDSESDVLDTKGEGSSANKETLHKEHDIEKYLDLIQAGVKNLKRQLRISRQKNRDLAADIEKANGTSSDDCPLNQLESDQSQIKSLKKQVKALKLENVRQKHQLHRYETKELEEETEGLKMKMRKMDERIASGEEELDPAHRMRKLLRRFSDLMEVSTLEPDEECPRCTQLLQPKKCNGLRCGHKICESCLPRRGVSRGADETVLCQVADCHEEPTPCEELERIHMTEQQRWDKLLIVAQAWDAFDQSRREVDTSEEESERRFFIDGNGSSASGTEASMEVDHVSEVESAISSTRPKTPDSTSSAHPVERLPFLQSPTKEKRKRMEQLAEERARKKKR